MGIYQFFPGDNPTQRQTAGGRVVGMRLPGPAIAFIALLALVMGFVSPVWGESADEATAIQSINTVPRLGGPRGEPVSSAVLYDSEGRIERVGENKLLIDDALRSLAVEVQYFGENGKKANKLQFTQGQRVGFKLNDDYEIVALWLLTR